MASSSNTSGRGTGATRLSSLSTKFIVAIVLVILAVEVVIFLPSLSGFRLNWLEDRLRVGVVGARVLDAVPDAMELPTALTDRLLESAGAVAIVYRREGQSQLLALSGSEMPREVVTADLRQRDPVSLIRGGLETLAAPPGRMLRIIGTDITDDLGAAGDNVVEVLMPEAPLRAEILVYARNTILLSLIVAVMTAVVLYVFVSRVFIRPVARLTSNLVAYRAEPERASLFLEPSARRDEIGVLEREIAAMESDIYSMLRQRRHLADLGLAVAKINHDLRNTLTAAQLLSDQVVNIDDPKVQRLAPRLVNTLDRAIGFAQAVLDYGRQRSTPPQPRPVPYRMFVEEAVFAAGLYAHPSIAVENQVPEGLKLSVDPDQFSRVLINLLKNAREALEAAAGKVEHPRIDVSFADAADNLITSVADNGPGLPPRARDNLFVAFEGSARSGGTGLGLAIARELTEAHGGKLTYTPLEPGTRFDIALPNTLRV